MKIKSIQLQSPDIAGTAIFYGDLLGLPVQQHSDSRISIQAGTTEIIFSEAARPAVYHMAIDIPHNQLEVAYAWLSKKTDVLPVAPGQVFSEFVNWQARSVYFYDNNGNVMELICRLGLDNASTAGFSASSLLHVSEIGMVCADVPAVAAELQQQYGLPIYPKQPPADNFTVLGDEDGLFILVSEGRPWYPTNVAAGGFPLKVLFETEQGIKMLQV